MFNYVRRKDNHTIIKMYGFVDFVGQFDNVIYEQISCEGTSDFPLGWELERQKTLQEKLLDLVVEVLDLQEKTEMFLLITPVCDSMSNSLVDVAEYIINNSSITQQNKDEMLAVL